MKYIYLDETESTNNYAKEHITEIEDKVVVYTSKQTCGRGRFDRTWVDLGSENIYMSIVLKPAEEMQKNFSNLTQYTALKLAETFEKYGVIPQIKWPNDILINNKKISGILAETVFRKNKLNGIVIGVGINLNANKEDFIKIEKLATSLNIEIGKDVDKQKFLDDFNNNFFNKYEKFLEQGFSLIKNDYEKYINFIGKEITINNLNDKVTGIAEKITDNGALIINNREFYTGDIV